MLRAAFFAVAAACRPRTPRSHRLDARFSSVLCLCRKRGFFSPRYTSVFCSLCVSQVRCFFLRVFSLPCKHSCECRMVVLESLLRFVVFPVWVLLTYSVGIANLQCGGALVTAWKRGKRYVRHSIGFAGGCRSSAAGSGNEVEGRGCDAG